MNTKLLIQKEQQHIRKYNVLSLAFIAIILLSLLIFFIAIGINIGVLFATFASQGPGVNTYALSIGLVVFGFILFITILALFIGLIILNIMAAIKYKSIEKILQVSEMDNSQKQLFASSYKIKFIISLTFAVALALLMFLSAFFGFFILIIFILLIVMFFIQLFVLLKDKFKVEFIQND
ncbi:Uncharacterised protein [Mycoplasmopsis citelli]|uniref:Uncharacterized protein n=1 Tax=Mycoplasmopsis citelli TaxID=171281 RepID=A0A449B285_9BACT|nr:hypothetical protein [Mycoplasmopsis citelli]VEU74702.1 Uncharacterised protein [Mycoplasmopsis citelli]